MKPLVSGFIVLWLLSTALYAASRIQSQFPPPIRVKGSFVIAAVCKDGIIVASDSRGTLKDTQGRRIAYYDINQKIFPIGDKLIADTGYASLNDARISFLSALMSRFAHSSLSRVRVEQLPNSYFKYAALVLPRAGADSAGLQTLVFAGYNRARPTLCIYDGELSRTIRCHNSGYVSSPHQHIVELDNVGTLSFAEAADVMTRTIDDYAAAVQPGSVGGPVVKRIITTAGSRWWGNPPNWPNWGTFADLAEDYRHDRVPFHLMPGITQKQLDRLIEDGAVWAQLGQSSNAQGSSGRIPIIGSNPPNR